MLMARARGWRVGSGSSSDGKNRAIIWGRVHVIEGGGRGNSALINLIGTESQRERI